MNDSREENLAAGASKWLFPFISIILGGGALWYTWFRYTSMINQPDSQWYGWVQLALFVLMGILCVSAAVLFILGKSSGWSMFTTGLSIVPLILFSNLIILVFRGIQNIMQGNADLFLDRLIAQPQKIVLIVIVLIALGWLGTLNERNKNRE